VSPFITGAFVGAGMMLGNVYAKSKNRGVPIESWPWFFLTCGLGGALWGLVILGPIFWLLGKIFG